MLLYNILAIREDALSFCFHKEQNEIKDRDYFHFWLGRHIVFQDRTFRIFNKQ